jgi:hypothetical protein
MQTALASHPPLPVRQLSMGRHTRPSPTNPGAQAQVLVPGPVDVQLALSPQPPSRSAQLFTALQLVPSPT